MKKYVLLIVFTIAIIYYTITFLSFITPIEPRLLNVIYSIIISFLLWLFWFFIPTKNNKR